MKRRPTHHARPAERQAPAFVRVAAMLALVTMLAMGSGALGHAHQQLQHARADVGLAALAPSDAAPSDQSSVPAAPDSEGQECDLCLLIHGHPGKMLFDAQCIGLTESESTQWTGIEVARPIALDYQRAHFARPPPARF